MSRRTYAPALAGAPRSSKLVKHKLEEVNEENEEYSASKFGGFEDYNRRKKIKLQNQDALIRARAPADLPAVFSGMVIHINGYTKPGRVELWNSIVTYGGVYKQYLEGKTDITHIVASNLTKKKQEEFARYRVVRPEWIVDSIAAGKALSWSDTKYRVIDAGTNQKVLGKSDQGGFSLTASTLSHTYKRMSGAHDDTGAAVPVSGDNSEAGATGMTKVNLEDEKLNTKDASLQTSEEAQVEVVKHEPQIAAPVMPISPVKPTYSRPVAKTAKDPDFIQDYFRNSRLHHLSTWKANLRLKIDNLAKARSIASVAAPKLIMHIDFDCFFAAVSSMGRSDLVDKACAVTHGGSNSGEIASCNYKAREYGIRNGMWMKEAVKLCSDIISLPYEFEAYEKASDVFYQILLGLGTQAIEAVSIDEALLDVSNLFTDTMEEDLDGKVEVFASSLRSRIRGETGVEVSLGIGANVLQAKLATKKAKPAGHFHLRKEAVLDFLDEFEVASIPGVGYSTAKKLEEQLQVTRIQELRAVNRARLQDIFGPKAGISLAEASLGHDDTVVGEISQRKLVSIEINWGIRLDTPEEVADYMRRVSEELCRKLREVGFTSAQHLLVKVMRRSKTAPIDPPKFLGHGLCDKFNAGREIPNTGDPAVVWKHSLALLESLNIPPNELRGIGVALTKLQLSDLTGNQGQRPMSKFFFPDPLQVIQRQDDTGKQDTMRPPMRMQRQEKRPSGPVDVKLPTLGTQFAIPSQIDSTVLEQLPDSIKEKIVAQRIRQGKSIESAFTIPSLSQIDPADLAALPASVRHEIVLHSRGHLPRSPNKQRNKTLNKFVIKTPSPKKNKTKGVIQTLTQGNFIDRPVARNLSSALLETVKERKVSSSPSSDIDRDVLAILPDDIREEIVADDRKRRMAAKLRQDKLLMVKSLKDEPSKEPVEKLRRTLLLPQKRTKHLLGDLGNESLQSLRRYLSTWYSDDPENGPDPEDLTDFEGYLAFLVTDERDLERVESLLGWLSLIVAREGSSLAWSEVVKGLVRKTNDLMLQQSFGSLRISHLIL